MAEHEIVVGQVVADWKWRSSSCPTRSGIGTERLDRFDFGLPN
jgi:hypothetical protein